MKKLIAAMAALLLTANAFASIALSGKYTGTLNDSGVYTQDLVTTLVGASAAGAVTVTLDKDFAVDDMFVESTIGGIKFKLGEVDDVTSIGASTTIGPITVTADTLANKNTGRTTDLVFTLNAGDISVSSIANGTSNVDIVGVSGNVSIKSVKFIAFLQCSFKNIFTLN